MIPLARSFRRVWVWLALGSALLGAGGCRQAERLLLLDVRASGGLPTTVASVRFSATDWPTRSAVGALGPAGLLFGYYGPKGSGPVTVTVQAVDASGCVLGDGSATVLDTASGKTAAATVVYVYPRSDTGCVLPDAGFEAGVDSGVDAPTASDAGDAAPTDGGRDAEAGADVRVDASPDAGADSSPADTAGDLPPDTGSAVDAASPADAASADALDATTAG